MLVDIVYTTVWQMAVYVCLYLLLTFRSVCLVRGVGWVVGLLKSVGNIATNCAKELDTVLKDTEILSLDATNQD